MARNKWALNAEDKIKLREKLRETNPELETAWNSYGRLRIREKAEAGEKQRMDQMQRMLRLVRAQGFNASISTATFKTDSFSAATWGTWAVTINIWKGQKHERS